MFCSTVKYYTNSNGGGSNGSNAGHTMFRGRVQDYWLPTPIACFPFTSLTVRHQVPSHFNWALLPERTRNFTTTPSCSDSVHCCVHFSAHLASILDRATSRRAAGHGNDWFCTGRPTPLRSTARKLARQTNRSSKIGPQSHLLKFRH